MTAPDLTPAEARAEVEAFLGEGWELYLYGPCANDQQVIARAWHGSVALSGYGPTYRAAVSALKQAWRDAVRPWVRSGVLCGGADSAETTDEINTITHRVLKEDSNG